MTPTAAWQAGRHRPQARGAGRELGGRGARAVPEPHGGAGQVHDGDDAPGARGARGRPGEGRGAVGGGGGGAAGDVRGEGQVAVLRLHDPGPGPLRVVLGVRDHRSLLRPPLHRRREEDAPAGPPAAGVVRQGHVLRVRRRHPLAGLGLHLHRGLEVRVVPPLRLGRRPLAQLQQDQVPVPREGLQVQVPERQALLERDLHHEGADDRRPPDRRLQRLRGLHDLQVRYLQAPLGDPARRPRGEARRVGRRGRHGEWMRRVR